MNQRRRSRLWKSRGDANSGWHTPTSTPSRSSRSRPDPFQPTVPRSQARTHLCRFRRAANGVGGRGGRNGHADASSGRRRREQAGAKHRAMAVEDVRMLEVSTPELDDVVRVEDDYHAYIARPIQGRPYPRRKSSFLVRAHTGRGHVGLLAWQAGFEIVFVDEKAALVDALRRQGRYPVKLYGHSRRRSWFPATGASFLGSGGDRRRNPRRPARSHRRVRSEFARRGPDDRTGHFRLRPRRPHNAAELHRLREHDG